MKSWPTKKLGKICDFVFGFSFRASEFNAEGKGLPVIRIGDIDKGVTAKFFDGKCNPRYLVKKNNLLIGLSGTIKIAKWQGNAALLNQRVVKLTNFSESIYPDFVYYQMPRILRGLEEKVSKLTVKNVLLPHLQNLEILAPPLKIQKRIVEKIEELFGKIDKAKELRQKALEETGQIFPSALEEVFTKAEKKWNSKLFHEVVHIDTTRNTEGNLPFVGMEDIESNSGNFVGSLEPKKVKSTTFRFGKKHVLYGKLRPYLNKVFVPNFEGHCSTEFLPLLPDSKYLIREWLATWLRYEKTVENIMLTTTGSRMPRANMDRVENFEIPLPPLLEQKKIVVYLDGLQEKVEKLQKLQKETQKEIDELKQSILSKAFKGKL